jgi:hypothetical protein
MDGIMISRIGRVLLLQYTHLLTVLDNLKAPKSNDSSVVFDIQIIGLQVRLAKMATPVIAQEAQWLLAMNNS